MSVYDKFANANDLAGQRQNYRLGQAKVAQIPNQQRMADLEVKGAEQQNRMNQLKEAKTKIDMVGQLLGSAVDQPSYDAARQKAQSLGLDVSSEPTVFDPNYIRQSSLALLDVKDKIDLELKQAESALQQDLTRAKIGTEQAQAGSYGALANSRNAAAERLRRSPEMSPQGNRIEGLSLKDRVGVEKTLRDDYQAQSKEWQTISNFYQRGLEGERAANAGNPQGDQTLIYSFMKLQDPNSVVMPGEYATAGSFKGVPEGLIQTYNKALKGDALSPQQRANISQQLEAIFRQKANQQVKNEKNYKDLASRSGADPQSVMIGVPTVTQISPTWPTEKLSPPPMKGTKDTTPSTPRSQMLPPPDASDEDLLKFIGLGV